MKLHRITGLVVIGLSCFLLSGCSTEIAVEDAVEDLDNNDAEEVIEQDSASSEVEKSDATVELVEFVNEDKNFILIHPSDWIIVDKDRYGVLLRPYDGTQTSFYVDTETSMFADTTFDSFVEDMMGDVMRIRSECSFSDPLNMQINDYPFVNLDYTCTSADGVNYYYRAFFTANNLGYEIYFVADETEYELYQKIMEDIAMSFKFINP